MQATWHRSGPTICICVWVNLLLKMSRRKKWCLFDFLPPGTMNLSYAPVNMFWLVYGDPHYACTSEYRLATVVHFYTKSEQWSDLNSTQCKHTQLHCNLCKFLLLKQTLKHWWLPTSMSTQDKCLLFIFYSPNQHRSLGVLEAAMCLSQEHKHLVWTPVQRWEQHFGTLGIHHLYHL